MQITIQDTHETIGVRRSSRIERLAIYSDYMVYLQGSEYDVGSKDDFNSFS